MADAFGLVRLGRLVALPGTLVVPPAITPLPWTAFGGTWLKADGSRASTAAAAGEDDVVPRAYRDGDELRRVHWRSSARYGELMVRREEQRWRNRATLFLDTRGGAHAGRGPSSSFEYAVSAAASIGVHLAREGISGDFVTDAGLVSAEGQFEDEVFVRVVRQPVGQVIADRRLVGRGPTAPGRAVVAGRPLRGGERQLRQPREQPADLAGDFVPARPRRRRPDGDADDRRLAIRVLLGQVR